MKKERINGRIIIRVSILWFFIMAIICTFIIAFFRNFIFATNTQKEENDFSDVEPNESKVDILQLILDNNNSNKKLVNEDREIKFDIKKQKDNQVPEGEEVIKIEGQAGTRHVIALQEVDENSYVKEEILENNVTKEPVMQVVHVGTSKFLSKYKVHIGEDMYLTENTELKKEAKDEAEDLTTINRYINLEILEVSENWTKVKYKEDEGYLPNDKLTSEAVNPKIKEKSRIANLQANLNIEMDLNRPSGLTLSDFKTALGYNLSDKNNIFSDNYEVFYNAEKKYGINGIFLAAIGIHESAWGTSYLAKEKKNLFGYKAYDRDPINSAQDFESYEDCINTVAEAIAKNYLTTTGSFYNGTTAKAVNTKYATDEHWHERVYSYMEYLYGKLG